MPKPRLKDLAQGTKDLFMLDPRIIREEPGWNVRQDTPALREHIRQLADSIKEVGVQEPVTVYLKEGAAVLTNGHCRLKAALLAIEEGAELKAIPARAEERWANEADRVLGMITRNSGKALSTLEQAEVVRRLLDFGWSEPEIARKTGYSGTHIANLVKLIAAPEEVKALVREGKVSARHAIETIRRQGEAAKESLAQAVETAEASGAKRATGKHMPSRGEDRRRKTEDGLSAEAAGEGGRTDDSADPAPGLGEGRKMSTLAERYRKSPDWNHWGPRMETVLKNIVDGLEFDVSEEAVEGCVSSVRMLLEEMGRGR